MGLFDQHIANAITVAGQITLRLDRVIQQLEGIRTDSALLHKNSTETYPWANTFPPDMVDGHQIQIPLGEAWLVDLIACETYFELREVNSTGSLILNSDMTTVFSNGPLRLMTGQTYNLRCGSDARIQADRVMIDNNPRRAKTGGEGGFINGTGPRHERERDQLPARTAATKVR